MDFVLSVWREACRHIELEDSIDRIARLLTAQLPADALMVRGLNYAHGRLETVAVGLCRSWDSLARTVTPCTQEQMSTILACCPRPTIRQSRPDLGGLSLD